MGKKKFYKDLQCPSCRQERYICMKCNYKNTKNNAIPRWVWKIVDGKVEKIQLSEEEYVKRYFEEYGIEIVTQKDKLIDALKNGDYIIGIDYNPLILQDVFHYDNDKFEFLKFRDIDTNVIAPLRLKRETSIYCPDNTTADFDAFIKVISKYDDFIVSRKGYLLDIENIPPSLLDMMQEELKTKGNSD